MTDQARNDGREGRLGTVLPAEWEPIGSEPEKMGWVDDLRADDEVLLHAHQILENPIFALDPDLDEISRVMAIPRVFLDIAYWQRSHDTPKR